MLCKIEANPQEDNNAEARSQQCRFALLLKLHPHKDMLSNIRSTSAEHPRPGDHLRVTAFACQKIF